MRKKLFFLVALTGIISGCKVQIEDQHTADSIIGYWGEMIVMDTIQTLRKLEDLPNDGYAIAFMENGQLTENKNAGWCGTPPISYSNYEGTWELRNDTSLYIESSFWGGNMTMTWIILEVSDATFSYYVKEMYYDAFQ